METSNMKPDLERRRRKLKPSLKKLGADAFLVTDITNVSYLTGFTGSSAYLLVTAKDAILLSDTRYETQIADECGDLEVDIRDSTSTLLDSVERLSKSFQFNSIAIEADSLSKSQFDQLAARLSADLVTTSGVVEKLRAVKDKFELRAIRDAIRINERAFEVIRSQLTSAQTERQVAHNLEHQIRAFGGTGCAFAPIVGVGERAALPHGKPTERTIGSSYFVLIDWGTRKGQYLSDLTRMIITGKPERKFRLIYEIVLEAQLAAIAAIRPGQTVAAIDAIARKVIADEGFGSYFGHGLGHSFGLQIHELPFLSAIHEGVLEPGMVLTVEPGIYLPRFGGVRIEDDILVTKDGCEVLSRLPKQFDECTVDLLC